MYRGKELEEQVHDAAHIRQVLAEIERNFTGYFDKFSEGSLKTTFAGEIQRYEVERQAYRDYLDLKALEEFEFDPGAFKSHTRNNCPIIRRCVNSPDDVMKAYRRSFNEVSGRTLLDTVRHMAEFGWQYAAQFDNEGHEEIASHEELGLAPLNDEYYHCTGVVGYGIQSSLLYGLYAREFAHRSQDAVWSLYFLSGRKDFGLQDGSEFLMVRPNEGTCEQNFFYPAELFAFYGLWLLVLLRSACEDVGLALDDEYRYTYLSAFCDHVAEIHREDINCYKWSSDHVEAQPWF